MIQRFAAGSMVAAVVVAAAVLIVLLIPSLSVQRMSPLITFWCFGPAVWGLWALIAPKPWVPERLPFWGAGLGLIAGLLAMFVVDLPSRILGEAAPSWRRAVAVLVLVVLYFLLWMVVRRVYRRLMSGQCAG